MLSWLLRRHAGNMIGFARIAAILLVLTVSARGDSFLERSGINSFLGNSPSTQDFVTWVVVGEMFEIELAKLAEQGAGEKTKLFAAELLKDHQHTSLQLKALVQGGSVKVLYPTVLDNDRQKLLKDMKALSGAEFDDRFESLQTDLHEETISLFERYGSDGQHPDLKIFAYKYLPHLRGALAAGQGTETLESHRHVTGPATTGWRNRVASRPVQVVASWRQSNGFRWRMALLGEPRANRVRSALRRSAQILGLVGLGHCD